MADEGYQWGDAGPGVKVGAFIPVSGELLRQADETHRVFTRWQQMTPEERARQLEEAAAARAAERAATPRVALAFDTLLDKLGWSREYAEHLVQPYCTCGEGYDGWEFCQHAHDEGIE
jgi:hypothetical protein